MVKSDAGKELSVTRTDQTEAEGRMSDAFYQDRCPVTQMGAAFQGNKHMETPAFPLKLGVHLGYRAAAYKVFELAWPFNV